MPSKRTYRATRIQSLDTTQLVERLPDGAPVVDVPVALPSIGREAELNVGVAARDLNRGRAPLRVADDLQAN